MPKPVYRGPILHKARSLAVYLLTSLRVRVRHALGRPTVPEWTPLFEIGTLFWRAQFNHAFALKDIKEGRAYFDSLYAVPDIPSDVEVRASLAGEPRGDWFIPRVRESDVTMLYFHGGGYTFYAAVTRLFIAMLAQKLGIAIFASDYRLTPEHPHPAQIEDSLAAYRFLLAQGKDPREIVVGGDSAGGHLTLMTLVKLRESGLSQPALAIGLSPWTDIGRRGASQFGNDRYDMVQGYMTLQFAAWLKGGNRYTDAELSPIDQDLRGLAPIYLQAGGKEILVDMIQDFAQTVKSQGGQVRLDIWPHMNHEFQAYGDDLPESREALERIREAIMWATRGGDQPNFQSSVCVEMDCLADEICLRTLRQRGRHDKSVLDGQGL